MKIYISQLEKEKNNLCGIYESNGFRQVKLTTFGEIFEV